MKVLRRYFLLMVLLCIGQNAVATNYYISESGNDSNIGTSISEAWLTINKVNTYAFNPGFFAGDTVLFEGGKIFSTSSSIYLRCDKSNGTATNPLVFKSFDNGKAILKAEGCHLFKISAPDKLNVQLGIEITDLILEGDSTTQSATSNASGISVYNNSSLDLDYLLIEDVEIRGFAGNGIDIGGVLGKGRFTHLKIKDVSVHHNPGAPEVSPHTGSGILVGGADSVLIEHCIAHNNGINNYNSGGPIGIWFWDCTNSIIQYCESYENKTTSGDGGGFDLDGACQNCIIQYCYSHDNYGAGFLLAQFSGASDYGPLSNNIIRYNISENDGRKGSYSGIYLWGATSKDFVGENYIYNNTVYMGETPLSGSPACIGFSGRYMKGIKIWNNIFMSSKNLNLINSNYSYNTDTVIFQNNVYYADSLYDFKIKWLSTFSSLSSWRDGSDEQEMNGVESLGLETNPMFISPGNGITVDDTYLLNTLDAYKLKSTSPLIDSASNLLDAPFSLLNVGQNDFYGKAIPVGGEYDFGAYDTTNKEWPEINLGNDITSCHGDTVTIAVDSNFDSYLWSTGEISQSIKVTSSGIYSLTVSKDGYINSDTIQVTFNSLPEVDLGDDINSCQGDIITLDAGSGFESYLWRNGEETQSIQVSTSGKYGVTVSQNGCTNYDSVQILINPVPYLNLGNDTVIGQNQTLILDAGNNFSNYIWSTGENTETIEISRLAPGNHSFSVQVTDSNTCSNSDTINVYVSVVDNDFVSAKINSDIIIYPNPSNGLFNLEFDESNGEYYMLSVYSLTGKLLKHQIIKHGLKHYLLDLQDFSTGAYILEISSDHTIVLKTLMVRD